MKANKGKVHWDTLDRTLSIKLPSDPCSPSYLGAFVLAYSQREMLKHLKQCDYTFHRIHTGGFLTDTRFLPNYTLGEELEDIHLEVDGSISHFHFLNVNCYRMIYGDNQVKKTKHYDRLSKNKTSTNK